LDVSRFSACRAYLCRVTNLYCDKVLERLAHFQTLNVQVTGVQKVVDPLPAIVVSLLKQTSADQLQFLSGGALIPTSDCAISLS